MTKVTSLPKKPKPPAQPPTGGADFIAIASRLSALLGLPVPTESIARVVAALDHCYERGHKAAMDSAQISLQNAVRDAVNDERESCAKACAKACEEVRDDCWSGSKEYEAAARCVEAIRIRSNQ